MMYNCTLNDSFSCLVYEVTTVETAETGKSSLISQETKIIFEYIIHIGFFYATSVLGVTANIINITVYKRQGLKESITLGFFVLSVSDLFVSALPIETATCYALNFIYPDSNINFNSIHYVNSSWMRRLVYSFSCSITALLSLERCLSVILPFKVKFLFTKSRTATIITCTLLLHVLCFIPIFATHRLRWQPSPSRNGSDVLRVWLTPHRDVIEDFNITLISIVVPTLAQIFVTCCAIVMIKGLRESSGFRHAVTAKATTNPSHTQRKRSGTPIHAKSKQSSKVTTMETTENDTTQQQITSPNDVNLTEQQQQQNVKRITLSQRDARLVRTMVFVVAIFSACNIPYLTVMYAIVAVPDLDLYHAYHNTFSLILSINYVLGSINASLNIFVYYNTSTRYRDVFRQIFCRAESK